jgi:hypothetical protein
MGQQGIKKFAAGAVEVIAAAAFLAAWSLSMYWSQTRSSPDPAFGRVVEESSHGRKYYLTITESRIVSEPVFVGSVLLIFVAASLKKRWDTLKP